MTLASFATELGIPMEMLIVLIIWSILWKGASLWVSARSANKWWFIILLLVSTVGILDAIYLFAVKKGKWPKEVKVDKVT